MDNSTPKNVIHLLGEVSTAGTIPKASVSGTNFEEGISEKVLVIRRRSRFAKFNFGEIFEE